MVGKFGPNEVFIVTKEEGVENAYYLDATNFGNNEDELKVVTNLLNIIGTFQVVPNLVPTTSTSPFKLVVCFYVEMPQSLATPINNQQNELVVNLDDYNLELIVLTIPSQIQEL
jgi:hypothetical protein